MINKVDRIIENRTAKPGQGQDSENEYYCKRMKLMEHHIKNYYKTTNENVKSKIKERRLLFNSKINELKTSFENKKQINGLELLNNFSSLIKLTDPLTFDPQKGLTKHYSLVSDKNGNKQVAVKPFKEENKDDLEKLEKLKKLQNKQYTFNLVEADGKAFTEDKGLEKGLKKRKTTNYNKPIYFYEEKVTLEYTLQCKKYKQEKKLAKNAITSLKRRIKSLKKNNNEKLKGELGNTVKTLKKKIEEYNTELNRLTEAYNKLMKNEELTKNIQEYKKVRDEIIKKNKELIEISLYNLNNKNVFTKEKKKAEEYVARTKLLYDIRNKINEAYITKQVEKWIENDKKTKPKSKLSGEATNQNNQESTFHDIIKKKAATNKDNAYKNVSGYFKKKWEDEKELNKAKEIKGDNIVTHNIKKDNIEEKDTKDDIKDDIKEKEIKDDKIIDINDKLKTIKSDKVLKEKKLKETIDKSKQKLSNLCVIILDYNYYLKENKLIPLNNCFYKKYVVDFSQLYETLLEAKIGLSKLNNSNKDNDSNNNAKELLIVKKFRQEHISNDNNKLIPKNNIKQTASYKNFIHLINNYLKPFKKDIEDEIVNLSKAIDNSHNLSTDDIYLASKPIHIIRRIFSLCIVRDSIESFNLSGLSISDTSSTLKDSNQIIKRLKLTTGIGINRLKETGQSIHRLYKTLQSLVSSQKSSIDILNTSNLEEDLNKLTTAIDNYDQNNFINLQELLTTDTAKKLLNYINKENQATSQLIDHLIDSALTNLLSLKLPDTLPSGYKRNTLTKRINNAIATNRNKQKSFIELLINKKTNDINEDLHRFVGDELQRSIVIIQSDIWSDIFKQLGEIADDPNSYHLGLFPKGDGRIISFTQKIKDKHTNFINKIKSVADGKIENSNNLLTIDEFNDINNIIKTRNKKLNKEISAAINHEKSEIDSNDQAIDPSMKDILKPLYTAQKKRDKEIEALILKILDTNSKKNLLQKELTTAFGNKGDNIFVQIKDKTKNTDKLLNALKKIGDNKDNEDNEDNEVVKKLKKYINSNPQFSEKQYELIYNSIKAKIEGGNPTNTKYLGSKTDSFQKLLQNNKDKISSLVIQQINADKMLSNQHPLLDSNSIYDALKARYNTIAKAFTQALNKDKDKVTISSILADKMDTFYSTFKNKLKVIEQEVISAIKGENNDESKDDTNDNSNEQLTKEFKTKINKEVQTKIDQVVNYLGNSLNKELKHSHLPEQVKTQYKNKLKTYTEGYINDIVSILTSKINNKDGGSIDNLSDSQKELLENYTNLNEIIKKLPSQNVNTDDQNTQLNELKNKLEEEKKKNKELQNKANLNQNDQVQGLNAQLLDEKSKVTKLNNQLNELKKIQSKPKQEENNTELRNNLNKTKTELNNTKTRLNNITTDLQQKLDKANKTILEKEQTIDNVKAALDDANKKVKSSTYGPWFYLSIALGTITLCQAAITAVQISRKGFSNWLNQLTGKKVEEVEEVE